MNPGLKRIADELGASIVGPLQGGEFGATLVRNSEGRELVLKTLPSPQFASRVARGAKLAGRLRALGYPAPEYVGTGASSGLTWSLQERLPGRTPDVMTVAHAQTLVELAKLHDGAAGEVNDWRAYAVERMHAWAQVIAACNDARTLAGDLLAVTDRAGSVRLLDDGVVHADFHHRNYLAIGEQLTRVFDWDLATVGDWRVDLVTLAFWSSILPEAVPPDVARIIIERTREVCPPDVLAFLAAYQALRQLDYDIRVHPDRLARLIPALETTIAPWWRSVL